MVKKKMRLHELKAPQGAYKKRKIVGRGTSSGHGKTCGRGHNGQKARAGRDFYLGFEGGQTPLMRRIPKRGFRSKSRREFQLINLKDLINKFKQNSTIEPKILKENGLIKNECGPIKILGEGDLSYPITVRAHAFSRAAKDKIENVGGKAEIIC